VTHAIREFEVDIIGAQVEKPRAREILTSDNQWRGDIPSVEFGGFTRTIDVAIIIVPCKTFSEARKTLIKSLSFVTAGV